VLTRGFEGSLLDSERVVTKFDGAAFVISKFQVVTVVDDFHTAGLERRDKQRQSAGLAGANLDIFNIDR
jgi:hypothetical protein